jgi:tRNA1(Val) A37 N6-methylase TrmN6
MDKKELQKLLNQPYMQENWKEIVQFVFPNVSILASPKEFPINNDKIKKFCQIGNVRLNDGKNLALFELILGDSVNLQRNRVELNNEISKYIDQEQIHGVLSVFEQGGDDYRFTFSAKSTEFDEEQSDFIQKKTDTKRFTYVLGKNESCKTPADRFFKLSEKKSEVDINAIQNAFSVEQLSKEFFEKYKKQFDKFWTYINSSKEYKTISFGDDREKGIRDFTKKLLGRIVFLHFLQKKGWLGCAAGTSKWEDGDKQFMQNLLQEFEDKEHFHSKCLAELFYNTLNRKRTDDLFVCVGLGDTLNNTKVPYLNGGLFDSDEVESRKIDFPEKYFEDLLDFFGQYNFTIDENDPNEHEVGIDPEMLGHIFENLLEDNKDKGAFYTPKVIVQYMCQESLIEYISTKLNAEANTEIKEAIEDLVSNRLAEKCSDLDLVEPIAQALLDVKVCDPAIGSGAFPMGILNTIYQVIEELFWLQPDSVARVWNICDTEWQPHLVKKNIIQHSIYGVDLESGAVDIARLRFWLALVVDEIEPLPLPNLDYKIMQGNSLLESFEGIDLSEIGDAKAYEKIYDKKNQIDLFTGEIKTTSKISTIDFEDVKILMDEYFNANNPETKKDLHKRIDYQVLNHIRFTLTQHKQDLIGKTKRIEKKLKIDEAAAATLQQKEKIRTTSKAAKELDELNKDLIKYLEKETKLAQLSKSNERPFFLWHLFFQEVFDKGGFDIVIGNPPYGNLFSEDEKITLKQYYLELQFKIDAYSAFIILGHRLLKERGELSYIIPSTFMDNKFEENVRNLVLNESRLKLIHELDDKIFDSAVVHSMIIGFQKSTMEKEYLIKSSTSKNLYEIKEEIPSTFFFKQQFKSLAIRTYKNREFIEKLSNNSTPLKEVVDIRQAIKTGNDSLYVQNVQNGSNWKPILGGKHIKKYQIIPSGLYVNYGNHLACPRDESIFNQPKILIREAGKEITATYDDSNYYIMSSLYNVILRNPNFNLKYVLALINSKLFQYLMQTLTFDKTKGAFTKAKIFHYYELPVKNVDQTIQDSLAKKVDRIIKLNNIGVSADEEIKVIDVIIFKLYGLTIDEVKLIDQEIEFTTDNHSENKESQI